MASSIGVFGILLRNDKVIGKENQNLIISTQKKNLKMIIIISHANITEITNSAYE